MSISWEAQQIDDLEQVRGHHRDAQVEEAIAEADGTFESVQGLQRDFVLHRGVAVGVIRREGLLINGGSSLTGLLELANVTVALVVHLPGLTEDPASFDVCCQ